MAQPVKQLSSSDARAVKAFEKGVAYFEARLHDKALVSADEALSRDPLFAEAWLLKAEVWVETKENAQALMAYRKALRLAPARFPAALLSLAGMEMSAALYDSALARYDAYLGLRVPEAGRNKALAGRASASFAVKAVKHPVPFDPSNLGEGVNTADDEFVNAISTDASQLFFTVKLPSGRTYPDGQPALTEDFYMADLRGDAWGSRRALSGNINTSGNEGALTLSADGRYLFFAGCDRPGGLGSCDIYYSILRNGVWEMPRNLKQPVNSPRWDSQPSFSSDGRTLFFASTRQGTRGSSDLWMSRVGEDGSWSEPVNLGDQVNTTGQETSPLIHPDGQTLYFASDGHPGLGGLDLYFSRRQPDGSWGAAINLGYPINTASDELALIVDASGAWAYFSSDKLGGAGKHDIYRFPLYPEARPLAVTYMKGKVTDKESGAPVHARFRLTDLDSGEAKVESWSDRESGEFLVCIPSEKEYGLNVSAEGYLFHSEHFFLPGGHVEHDPYRRDVQLSKLRTGASVVMRNVFFETDQFTLLPTSRTELDRLAGLLSDNPGLSIEIGGHTDNVGSPAYNQTLSENRAATVYNYLISKGIAANRLSYKGYGLTRPVSTNDTQEGRALNRRTEFTVTGMSDG